MRTRFFVLLFSGWVLGAVACADDPAEAAPEPAGDSGGDPGGDPGGDSAAGDSDIDPCTVYCEALVPCGADPTSCASDCASMQTSAEEIGCSAELADQLACQTTATDPCAADCAAAEQALGACAGSLCDRTPADPRCGDACTTFCQATRTCPDEEPTVDCVMRCAGERRDADAAICTDQYNAFLACIETVADVCAPDECNWQAIGYAGCLGISP